MTDMTPLQLPATSSNGARVRLFRIEMERLKVHFGQKSWTPEDWALIMGSFWVLFEKIAISDLQFGVRKWLEQGKFFPKPAELFEACRSPFDSKADAKAFYRNDLPPAVPAEVAKAMVERAEAAGAFQKKATGEKTLAEIKTEILARPALVMTPEMQELEKALYQERMDNLDRRLESKHG